MKTVLICDNEPQVASFIAAALDGSYDAFTVYTGAVAIDFITTSQPNILILDYDLGHGSVSSFDVAAVAHHYGVPVIVLSGHATFADAAKFSQMGVDKFIEKPCSLIALLGMIGEIIGE